MGRGKGPPKGEGGAPRKDIDINVLKRAASIGCTIDEIAALLGIGRQTLYDHLKRDPELQQALDESRDQGRATLRRLQWQKANAGSDTMLIWLGKQMLQQRDKTAVTGEEGGPVAVEHTYRWAKPDEVSSS